MREAIKNLNMKNGQNPGLLFQRFLSKHDTKDSGKASLLEAVKTAGGNREVSGLYEIAYKNWDTIFDGEKTARNDFKTVGRLIVGLGTENVVESGIRLNHIYGYPILPGSALKGLAAHYCAHVWGETEPRYKKGEEFHKLLFGVTDDSGCVIFHDSWLVPDNTNPFVLDVITPHHQDFVDGKGAPTDYDSPVPVPFLSVKGAFTVGVTWNGPEVDFAILKGWTKLAFNCLAIALAEWGIGGKTSSGYGRMTEVDSKKRVEPSSTEGMPRKGEKIQAVLQTAPKKDNPWRATTVIAIKGNPRTGPIEGTAPQTPIPGSTVDLIITEIDEKSIKFKWS